MPATLADLRPVYVAGIGFHRYQFLSDTPYVDLGLTAVRAALADAGLAWPAVESAYFAKALLPMAPGRAMLRHLGASGLPIVHVENASAAWPTTPSPRSPTSPCWPTPTPPAPAQRSRTSPWWR